MNETTKCNPKSPYHKDTVPKKRIKRVLDELEEEAKRDEKETGATKESSKTPDWLKKELTEALREIVALTHDQYLWYKDQLANEEALEAAEIAKQQAFKAAEQAYQTADESLKSFIDNRRTSFIREAQDVEPSPDKSPSSNGYTKTDKSKGENDQFA